MSDPGLVVTPGEAVCHFGVITGESCGTIESVNNGWFTMANGVVSQKGDSGGPVYLTNGPGPARIVGMFNSMWGRFPAAVSWEATTQQIREDVGVGGPALEVSAEVRGQREHRDRRRGGADCSSVESGVNPATWPLTSQYHLSR